MNRTIEGILDQMRSSLQESNSELASFPEYGNLYAIFRAVAASIIEQDVKLNSINSNLFLNTATGESLDLKAQEFNITRNKGTYSKGSIIVLGNTVYIPANTILTDTLSGLQFVTDDDINILSNRSKGTITCTQYTPFGNLPAGTELFSSVFSNIKFIVGNSFNPLTNNYTGNLLGGTLKEDDDQLKLRIYETIKSLSLSNVDSLKIAAQQIEGVTKVSIIENEPSLGYITAYINNTETGFLKLVKDELDLIKPIGTALQVKPFNIVPVNVSISIESYNNVSQADLKDSIRLNIDNYINNLNPGSLFAKESLSNVILSLPDIYNVVVNNPSSNIQLRNNEIINLSNLTVSYI
jgi:uncharacterized phage protein gp47/JayE